MEKLMVNFHEKFLRDFIKRWFYIFSVIIQINKFIQYPILSHSFCRKNSTGIFRLEWETYLHSSCNNIHISCNLMFEIILWRLANLFTLADFVTNAFTMALSVVAISQPNVKRYFEIVESHLFSTELCAWKFVSLQQKEEVAAFLSVPRRSYRSC